jgi:hypothetical protein
MVKKIGHYPELVDLHGGTSKNSPRQLRTTKLPWNDSALFPFRFVDVHPLKGPRCTEINFSTCPGEVC